MKRYGHIIEEIVEWDNMERAFKYVLRGARGRSKSGVFLYQHKDDVIRKLIEEIESATFRIKGYRESQIVERGKHRTIQSVCLTDRVALNAIMCVVERYLARRFIKDSASSIKGRGTHYLALRIRRDMKRDPEGTRKVFKWDIHHYYDSIPQDKMMQVLRSVFKDARLLTILERCVTMMPKGLSIGLRSSQAFGNLYLDYYVDHVLKDRERQRYHRRYCDDGVQQDKTFYDLTHTARVVQQCTAEAQLQIKPNVQMWDINDRPLDFLGFVMYGNGNVRIRKHIKQRFARRYKRVKSRTRRQELVGSFYGIAKHAKAAHLFKTITGMKMEDFAKLGITYEPEDGKKQFDCRRVALSSLLNETIIIKDFEDDIKTREGDKRMLVLFGYEGRDDEGKFFTNSKRLKQILHKAQDANKLPFRTTIRKIDFGAGKNEYIFT